MANLQSSGAISLNDLKTFFGGPASPALSNYYRGGGYTPASYTLNTTQTEGPYYSQTYRWLSFKSLGLHTAILWNTSITSATYTSGTEYTSVYIAPYTYLRGALYSTDQLGKYYYVSRSYPVTTYPECNTGIPSSGTISLSHYYGAFKP